LKRVAFLIGAVLLLAPAAFAGPWNTSLSAAQKKSKESNKLIFVDFFADWCGWCHRMEQEVFPSQTFQNATDKMVLLRLNTEDGGDGTKLSQQFAVQTLPTFLVLTPDNMIAAMIRGYAPATDFVKTMNDSLAKYGEFQKRVSQEGSIAGDYQKRLDLAREFTSRYGLAQSETRLRKLIDDRSAPVDVRDGAYYEMAVSQLLQSHLDQAIKTVLAFGRVQTKGDSYERARFLLSQIYMQQGNFMAAANELRAFKAQFPRSPLIRNVEIMLPGVERQLSASKK
jgi:thiol:disulfide interchange protein DsbD